MKKYTQTFGEFINEQKINEAKFEGKDLYPDWISPNQVGTFITSLDDLVVGSSYVIFDHGDQSWHGDYKYIGKRGGEHTFKDTSTQWSKDLIVFTKKDIFDAIKDKDIREQWD